MGNISTHPLSQQHMEVSGYLHTLATLRVPEWALGPVWTVVDKRKSLVPARFQTPDHSAWSKSLYRTLCFVDRVSLYNLL